MTTTGSAAIQVADVHKSFGGTSVLRGVDLDVPPGSLVCLLGPSGCGKTTLLRSIAGLDSPDRGTVAIDGRAVVDIDKGVFVRPERRGLGMVFQHYALWPQMTVLQNISYPLKRRGVPRSERARLTAASAETVGLGELLDRYPHQLSGGQQQRVALARAVVHEPRVLLLDEPLSNLDASLRQQLRRELRRLHERLGSTMVHVTHDQEEAAAIADSVVVMDGGLVVQQGAPGEILNAPNSRFVAEFVGFDVFIAGQLAELNGRSAHVRVHDSGVIRTRVPHTAGPGSAVHVALRSRDLVLRTSGTPAYGDGASMRAVVRRVSPIGASADVEVQCGTDHLDVRVDGHPAEHPRVGDTVWVDYDPDRALALDITSPGVA